jgi:hypothetical protein
MAIATRQKFGFIVGSSDCVERRIFVAMTNGYVLIQIKKSTRPSRYEIALAELRWASRCHNRCRNEKSLAALRGTRCLFFLSGPSAVF